MISFTSSHIGMANTAKHHEARGHDKRIGHQKQQQLFNSPRADFLAYWVEVRPSFVEAGARGAK